MGHVKCAEAIAEEIYASQPDASVTTVDVMDYLFPHLSKAIYKGFSLLVTKLPGMYNHLNRAAGKHAGVPMKKTIAAKLDRLIAETQPDLIISNLPVCSKYISAYKELRVCTVPLFTYITDITVHDEWIADKTDLYFVGDESTGNVLISKGVSAEKIVVSGIPVKRVFKSAFKDGTLKDQEKADTGTHTKKRLLIMGGGLGLVPGGSRLLKRLNEETCFEVTLIAGKNRSLEKRARRKYKNINVVGFTDKISDYMAAADLVLTKPGGITTFEAIASRTPMYIADPFLEQEMGNARFIESKNIGRVIGRVVWSRDCDVASDIINFLKDTALIDTMKENMAKLCQSFSCPNPMQYFREFSSKSGRQPEIMLTFDDGPDPAYTGRLLDLLDSYGIKAAFFTVGSFASANPKLIRRMKDGGHTVGLHSYSHRSAYLMSAAQTRRDLSMSAAAVMRLGINPRFYRPPWGHTTPALQQAASNLGIMPVFWSVMAQDWQADLDSDEIASRLLCRTVPGSIICLHDGRGKNCAPGRTIAALEKVLPIWLKDGYRFVTPEEVYGR